MYRAYNQTKEEKVAFETAVRSKTPVEYSVVKRWTIPNGGWGKLIAIAPENANEPDLITLAQRIKVDVQSDRIAFIQVFTSPQAAQMRDRLDSLSDKENAFYQQSYVGLYNKNINTGMEEMEIHPSGMSGPSKTLKP